MSMTATTLRRMALLTLLTLSVGALIAARKRRSDEGAPTGPVEWPEFEAHAPSAPMTSWVIATGDDDAPDGFPVKVKVSSGIFHLPGGRFYDRTKPDRWYATAGAAQADGYRQSKS